MTPKIIIVYEARGSDGDRREWSKGIYKNKATAGEVSQKNWGTPIERSAIEVGGNIYLLSSPNPIQFEEEKIDHRSKGLAKLTDEEKKALGLKD